MRIQRRIAIYYKNLQSGEEPARKWLESLKDRLGRATVYTRVERAENGNFGDHKAVGEGVMELRINFGPGYRVYYALEGAEIILLLIGGTKSTQSKDIVAAKGFWDLHKAGRKGK